MSQRVVWKFPVTVDGVTSLPRGARLLHVGIQDGAVWLWAEVDPAAPLVERVLVLVKTGFDDIPDGVEHFGTVMLHEGRIVLHVYDGGER